MWKGVYFIRPICKEKKNFVFHTQQPIPLNCVEANTDIQG